MKNPTKKQEETLREFLHSAVVPLIEDVLVKKLGQAMSYAKEQLNQPKREWVGLTDEEILIATYELRDVLSVKKIIKSIEAKLKEKNT